jgi:LmbE family N-acetylglucosaminyl deacetylase
MRDTVLVIAAHPDDEILGCGATMARHAAAGAAVHVVIVAEGATSRGGEGGSDQVAALRQAGSKAASIVGAEAPRFMGMPDNRLDGLPLLDVVQPIEAIMAELHPQVVYTHHGGDLNVDHRIVHQATLTACRPLPNSPVREVLAFETVSSTEWGGGGFGPVFRPTHYVEATARLETKLEALRCYEMEMRSFPHARSYAAVEALASRRGAEVGVGAAEAFAVIRRIERG